MVNKRIEWNAMDLKKSTGWNRTKNEDGIGWYGMAWYE
jgi:hypothetical protein